MDARLRLVRQKRRFYLFGTLVAAAALIRLGPTFDAVFLGFIAVAMALIVLELLPAFRRLLEAAGMGLLIASFFPVAPDLFFALALIAGTGIYHVLHGSWSDRTDLRLAFASERTAMASLPIDALWQRIVPGAGHPDDFWTGTLIDFDTDPDDPLTLYVRYRDDRDLYSEATVTFFEQEAPRSCRFMIETEGDPVAEEKITAIKLTEAGEFATIVDSRVEVSNMTLCVAAGYWFDDTLGDEWDGIAITSHRAQRWFFTWPSMANRLSGRRYSAEAAQAEAETQPATGQTATTGPMAPTSTVAVQRKPRTVEDGSDFEEDFDIMAVLEDVKKPA